MVMNIYREKLLDLSFPHLHIWCSRRPEEGNRSPGPGNTSSSEPSDIEARKQTWVPKKKNKNSPAPKYVIKMPKMKILILFSVTRR